MPGARIDPLKWSRSHPTSACVAPTTRPTAPWPEAVFAAMAASTIPCATVAPSVRTALCTSPPSGLLVRASTYRQRRAVGEVRVGVRRHRRPDVTALGIDDHERAGRVSGSDRALQHGDARRTVRLEERRLRLEDRHDVTERLDHAARDGLEPGEAVLVAPGLDHRAVRIDPHAQSTPRGRDRSQAFSVRAHVVLPSESALMPATRPVPE